MDFISDEEIKKRRGRPPKSGVMVADENTEGTNSFVHSWGDVSMWKLICEYYDENFSKVTEAMEIPRVGCIVRTMFKNKITGHISESMLFVPNAGIKEEKDGYGEIVKRELIGKY